MMVYVKPSVREISSARAVVRIPLCRSTKNHLGSMYFGALSVGADCVVGVLVMHLIRQQPTPISLIFKSFRADFHKRAEGNVDFCCSQGIEIANLVEQAAASDERVQMKIDVLAPVPDQDDEPVATFQLMLSLKRQQ